MELPVLVQQTAGTNFRAWSGEPVPATAEGATREEALANLRAALEVKTAGVEVVRLQFGRSGTAPVWPDDELTRAWLDGIEAARQAADQRADTWDAPAGEP
ncbi:hypothetical protein [Gemmata sp.]|uniref:hypothetical protein n=1 Tax=Gemmata sp. TaxID=1914242 RepID=UPI003F6FABE0